MNELIRNLLKLQSLEFSKTAQDSEKEIEALRALVPPPILGHYDRLRARAKKVVSAVRNQVCTGCHVQVPRAVEINIMHGEDIQICENCGRYLYLPDASEPELPEVQPSGKAGVKTRRRPKAVAVA